MIKREKLQAVNYKVKSTGAEITVQKGWWFSAHEQWKYLYLPYLDSPVNAKVFKNGEKARTWDALDNKIPGMFASVTAPIYRNSDQVNYYSDCGIPALSYSVVGHRNLVTPYSTMGLFLADSISAYAWYYTMISGPAGQNLYGSTEAMSIAGDSVAPIVTWDSKITTVIGMLGGFIRPIADKMKKSGIYNTFINRIDTEWGRVFKTLKGHEVPYAMPNATIIHQRSDFTTCTKRSFPKEFAWGSATAAY